MTDELEIRALYEGMLAQWNRRNAQGMAAMFGENGNVIGFDGSLQNGRAEIHSTLGEIFAHHATAAYVAKIRQLRFLSADIAILRAVAGMVPPEQADLNPAVNAIQTLVVARHAGRWQIELLQNTPAQFHGRPELSQALTEELRQLL